MSKEMKDSGVEWIGDIPRDWRIAKFKYVSYLYTGNSISDSDKENFADADEAYPYISTKDISIGSNTINYLNGMWVKKTDNKFKIATGNSILICIEGGSAGKKISFLNQDVAFVNKLCCIKAFAILPKYLYYYCNEPSFIEEFRLNLSGLIGGVAVGQLKSFSISFPSPRDQQLIVDYLDRKCVEIDSIIENTKASIEDYKKYKKSIITEVVLKGLKYDAVEKDSGINYIGSIPSHWKTRKIKNILTPLNREVLLTDDVITCFRDGEVTLRKNRRTEGYTLSDTEKGYQGIEIGDLVIHGMDAFAGAIGISDSRGKCTPVVHVCDSKENKRYFMYFLRTLALNDVFMALSEGVRIRSSDFRNWAKLAEITAVLPPYTEQVEIVNYLDQKCNDIDNLIVQKQQIISKLESYKKSMIYECVTGKDSFGLSDNKQISTLVHPHFPAVLSTDKKRFAQAVLASKVIDIAHSSQFGRVKLEKILYTIETHIGFDFETDYMRQIAGPFDESIYQCEYMISRKNKWIKIKENKYGVKYSPARDMVKYKTYYNKYYTDYESEIERIINIFRPLSTDQSEIFATLYSSWNDFIIMGRDFTDEDIVNDVLNNWHDSKQRFSMDTWLHSIEQLKKLELTPRGYGKKTIIEKGW